MYPGAPRYFAPDRAALEAIFRYQKISRQRVRRSAIVLGESHRPGRNQLAACGAVLFGTPAGTEDPVGAQSLRQPESGSAIEVSHGGSDPVCPEVNGT